MKRCFLLIVLVAGCGRARNCPGPAQPSLYSFYEVGRATWSIEGEPLRLVQVKNRKTGKVYLLAYHDGVQAESMVKIDEWQEEPETK